MPDYRGIGSALAKAAGKAAGKLKNVKTPGTDVVPYSKGKAALSRIRVGAKTAGKVALPVGAGAVGMNLLMNAQPNSGISGGLSGDQSAALNNVLQGSDSADPGTNLFDAYYAAQGNPLYSTMVGGPNLGLINQLKADAAARLDRYKTNRADAENLYGQLTGKVEQLGTQIGQGYTDAITGAGTRQEAAQTRMSNELATQEQRRSQAAAELGLANENALTNYGSRDRVNEAMASLADSTGSWQNLLTSMQQSAAERNAAMKTSVGGALNQTVLGMKQQYDDAAAQIAQQIAAERSKTPTRKLNELGKMMTQGILDQIKQQTFGDPTASNKFMKSDKEANDYLAATIAVNPYTYPGGPNKFKTDMWRKISAKFGQAGVGSGTPLSPAEARIIEAYGWTTADLSPYKNASLLGNPQGK